MRVAPAALALISLVACIEHPDVPELPPGSDPLLPESDGPHHTNAPPSTEQPPAPPSALDVLQEVTYVLMKDWEGGDWMCTGTLVAKNVVVTAAHCLDESAFASWEVVAPLAEGQPRVGASSPSLMTYDYDSISEHDIGLLWLDEPIDLPAYAELADVVDRVDSGEAVAATAIVRTEEQPEAPFKAVDGLTVRSTTDRGYIRGFGTKYFSRGGDSGAGLFLVEGGRVTHKLIGIARQPERETDLDHFTRVDGDVLGWLREHVGE